jgi:hypothetical protein
MKEKGLAGSSSIRDTLVREISLNVPPGFGSCFLIRLKLDMLNALRSRTRTIAAAVQPNFFVIYLSSNNK